MPDKEFSGLWIPKDIIMDKGLTSTDKFILAAVEALSKEGACYAGNKYIAEVTGGSFELVRKTIYKLQKNGYLASVDNKDMFAFTAKRALVRVPKRQDGCGNGLPHDGNGLPPTSGNIVTPCGNRLPLSGNIFPKGGNIVTECGNRVPPYNIYNINNNILNNKNNNIAAAARAREDVDENFGRVAELYQNCIHPIPNQIERDDLEDLYMEFGADWLAEAIKESARSRAQSIRYVTAVLRRWKNSGDKEPWNRNKKQDESAVDKITRLGKEAMAFLDAQEANE